MLPRTEHETSLNSTPNNKEGRKLDIVGHIIYSLASFTLRAANYLATMGAYHHYLWNKALPSLKSASGEYKPCNLAYKEAMALVSQEHITVRHVIEVSSRHMATAIAIRRHAWL